jgi:pimeloyl-ACP methyl ester carboxylesterase
MARAAEARLPLIMRGARSRRLAFRDVMRRGELLAPADAVDLARSAARCQVAGKIVQAIRAGDDAIVGDLDRVDAPVLLAWAQFDRLLPAKTCSARFRNGIPGAEFRILPKVGHTPMWDNARLVTETIVDWVGGSEGGRR